jgi:hypothetical protein
MEAKKLAKAEYARQYYLKNKERIKLLNNKWRKENSEKCSAYSRSWRINNPGKQELSTKNWYENNPNIAAKKTIRRKHCQEVATVKWSNDFIIKEAYCLAKLRSKIFGFKWHVDHIVPLKSKFVCGLHVANNLQVIPALVNISKGNRYWPDM